MSSEKYTPPYKVSGKAMSLIAEIAAAIERYRILLEGPDGIRLRKVNHIRTIRGTTAIEGNTLSEEQITAILAGKRVIAPAREIEEVRCAHVAYSAVEDFNPYSIQDLLKAHALMTQGLLEEAGKFRRGNVGVMGREGRLVHMAPPAGNVPFLIKDLFDWVEESEDPMLVKSCVFHYEFEFIHPFLDGNGRMGRLWQTVLLGSWRNEFYGTPIENIVWAHQEEYYQAINASTQRGECGPFIDFMLDKILRTLTLKGEVEQITDAKTSKKTIKKTSKKINKKTSEKLVTLLRSMPDATLAELADATGLSIAGVRWNLNKLKDEHRIQRIGPDKGGHWEVL
jgi:Fic family protein